MHVVNHPRPWRAKGPAGLSGDTELLGRVAATDITLGSRVLTGSPRPASLRHSSLLEAGA